ncbi:enoyl-CoA hydratase [Desulfosarcina alkanivorans]|uniref:Enoyl-CoA hydratase n=1 Tax=Desulfosarcina alkanivorans TaxID=571177 RepID=A0A5K7YRW1_9BACT|nr:enoyl-CoA hydratase/isomerase family protein [Desulfosarcina alkanivorans]BBO69024.1 enoyl-CoA hydratase [Desulfosarcina alkanivorans]
MKFVKVEIVDGIAAVSLGRGKVNALNDTIVDELMQCLEKLAADGDIRAIVLTGRGKFFSFGFDIPEFLAFSKAAFTDFLTRFAGLYAYLFTFPKPVVAALNGHTIAGGCMLALACDYRIMISGRAKISLNEITFGASVFAGSTEMLRFWVGSARATEVLYSGAMYSAEEALDIGLVQAVSPGESLIDRARQVADDLAAKPAPAFSGIKSLLRKPVAEEMMRHEAASIREFVEIWYTEDTWVNIQNIKIR